MWIYQIYPKEKGKTSKRLLEFRISPSGQNFTAVSFQKPWKLYMYKYMYKETYIYIYIQIFTSYINTCGGERKLELMCDFFAWLEQAWFFSQDVRAASVKRRWKETGMSNSWLWCTAVMNKTGCCELCRLDMIKASWQSSFCKDAFALWLLQNTDILSCARRSNRPCLHSNL